MNTSDSIVETLVEVELAEPSSFLKIREILTRIGIPVVRSETDKTLVQTCHILHKRGKYFIVHFKEMLILDGKPNSSFGDGDIARRNFIALLLERWGHLEIVDSMKVRDPVCGMEDIEVVKFSDKPNWKLVHKYHFMEKN